jgi:hypothetical protein
LPLASRGTSGTEGGTVEGGAPMGWGRACRSGEDLAGLACCRAAFWISSIRSRVGLLSAPFEVLLVWFLSLRFILFPTHAQQEFLAIAAAVSGNRAELFFVPPHSKPGADSNGSLYP